MQASAVVIVVIVVLHHPPLSIPFVFLTRKEVLLICCMPCIYVRSREASFYSSIQKNIGCLLDSFNNELSQALFTRGCSHRCLSCPGRTLLS